MRSSSFFLFLIMRFFCEKTKGYFLFQVQVRSVRPLKYLRCVHLVCLTNNNKKRHPSHQDKHVKDNGRRRRHCRRSQKEFRFTFFFFLSRSFWFSTLGWSLFVPFLCSPLFLFYFLSFCFFFLSFSSSSLSFSSRWGL